MTCLDYAHILNMYALLLLLPGNVQVMRLSIDRMRSGLVDILCPGYAQTCFSYARCGGVSAYTAEENIFVPVFLMCQSVPRRAKSVSLDFYNTGMIEAVLPCSFSRKWGIIIRYI